MHTKRSLMTVMLFAAFTANSASFDCGKASTFIEKAICSDASVSELDTLLNETYKQAIKNSLKPGDLKSQQRAWLKNARNKCQDVKCLKQVYNDQIAVLRDIAYPANAAASAKADGYSYEPDDTFAPGEYVAIQDVKTYSDAVEDKGYLWKEYKIKQGTKIRIYSAGGPSFNENKELWFNLAEGSPCNNNLKEIFPPNGFDGVFLGAQGKHFKRVGDIPRCDTGN